MSCGMSVKNCGNKSFHLLLLAVCHSRLSRRLIVCSFTTVAQYCTTVALFHYFATKWMNKPWALWAVVWLSWLVTNTAHSTAIGSFIEWMQSRGGIWKKHSTQNGIWTSAGLSLSNISKNKNNFSVNRYLERSFHHQVWRDCQITSPVPLLCRFDLEQWHLEGNSSLGQLADRLQMSPSRESFQDRCDAWNSSLPVWIWAQHSSVC